MPVNIPALRTELLTDPTALGYAPHVASGNHAQLQSIIILVRNNIDVFRGVIQTYELLACVDNTEYTALTANMKQLLQTVISANQIDTADPGAQALVGVIFPNPSATRTAMLARAKRKGSRSEQLFGVNVSLDDIGKALQ